MTEEHPINPSIPAKAGIQSYAYQVPLWTPTLIVWQAKRQGGAIGHTYLMER